MSSYSLFVQTTRIHTKAPTIKDDKVYLNISTLNGHNDDLPPAPAPPLNPPQPPCPHMLEYAAHPLSPPKRHTWLLLSAAHL